MMKLSSKLREVSAPDSADGAVVALICGCCGAVHKLAIELPNANDQVWSMTGDLEAPSFSPAMPCGAHIINGQCIPAGSGLPLPDFDDASV